MKQPTRTPSRQASKAKPSQGLLIYGKVTSPAPRRAPSSTERGPREFATKVAKAVFGYGEIDPIALQAQLSVFLQKMHEVVQKLPGKVGEFSVDTV